MSGYNLTRGCLEKIMSGGMCNKPVIQILGHKKIMNQSNDGPDRFRLLISDGIHTVSSVMLATQLNDKIFNGQLSTNAVIKLDKYICNVIQSDKRVIVVLEISIVGTSSDVGSKIGNPTPIRQGAVQENQTEGSGHSEDALASSNKKVSDKSIKNNNQQDVPSITTSSKISPISNLNPYQNSWTIKARVTFKTPIRTWSNSRGEGKLFSINLVDTSGEIKATAFKNEVDKFYNLFEVGKVYFIKKGQLKSANKQFCNLKNDYEMTFNADTEVVQCQDEKSSADGGVIPGVIYDFITIDKIKEIQPGSFIDVIGVVKSWDECKAFITKQTNKELKKREITLVDQSLIQIKLTLWNLSAEKFECNGNPVFAIKGCKVSDWGGRTLSEATSSQILMNPPISETNALRSWYDSVGSSSEYLEYKREGSSGSGSNHWMNLREAKVQGVEDQPLYYQIKAMVYMIKKDNCLYKACPSVDCNKKVIDMGGSYRCEKCAKTFNDFNWRIILNMNVSDFSGSAWVTCFQDAAEVLLKEEAQKLGELKSENSPLFDKPFSKLSFNSFIFKMRTSNEVYNDEKKLKNVGLQVSEVDQVQYSKELISRLEKFTNEF